MDNEKPTRTTTDGRIWSGTAAATDIVQKEKRYRCKRGHEWTGSEPLSVDLERFGPVPFKANVLICYECTAAYLRDFFGVEEVLE